MKVDPLQAARLFLIARGRETNKEEDLIALATLLTEFAKAGYNAKNQGNIRYKLIPSDIKYLTKEYREGERIFVKQSDDPIWVNILEVKDEDWAKLRLYFSDGSIQEGWTWQWESCRPVEIHNIDELFDGRFNQ